MSEKRNVGSTRADTDSLVDLMGDGDGNQGIIAGANSAVNTQDLLADIFGGSTNSAAQSTPIKAVNPVDDIMSLFGNSNAGSSSQPEPPSRSVDSTPLPAGQGPSNLDSALYNGQQMPSISKQPTGQPKSSLQHYIAYEKNDLKITLTPKVNPAQPGMVQILVRFSATASVVLENVNFQAAVPKVSCDPGFVEEIRLLNARRSPADPTIANAGHEQWERCPGNGRNTTDAHHRTTGCTNQAEIEDHLPAWFGPHTRTGRLQWFPNQSDHRRMICRDVGLMPSHGHISGCFDIQPFRVSLSAEPLKSGRELFKRSSEQGDIGL